MKTYRMLGWCFSDEQCDFKLGARGWFFDRFNSGGIRIVG